MQHYYATAAANNLCARKGYLRSVTLTAGADAASLSIYDAATVTGTPIVKVACPIGTTQQVLFNFEFSTGLTTAITGTTPSIMLDWE